VDIAYGVLAIVGLAVVAGFAVIWRHHEMQKIVDAHTSPDFQPTVTYIGLLQAVAVDNQRRKLLVVLHGRSRLLEGHSVVDIRVAESGGGDKVRNMVLDFDLADDVIPTLRIQGVSTEDKRQLAAALRRLRVRHETDTAAAASASPESAAISASPTGRTVGDTSTLLEPAPSGRRRPARRITAPAPSSNRWTVGWQAIFVLLLLAYGFFSVSKLRDMAQTMKEALEISRQSLELSRQSMELSREAVAAVRRAWVVVKHVDGLKLGAKREGRVAITFGNVGGSSAHEMRVTAYAHMGSGSFGFVDLDRRPPISSIPNKVEHIDIGSHVTVQFVSPPFSSEEISQFQSGSSRIYIRGSIDYSDDFARGRTTGFCYGFGVDYQPEECPDRISVRGNR
jgi:hypothetical protein